MVRPSFVLGGRAMAVVFDDAGLEKYMREAVAVSNDQPILLDRFLDGAQELDIDVVCDGEQVVIAGLLAHIEEAGIHSGDSYAVIPALGVPEGILETVKGYARRLALDLGVRGLMNLQFAVKDGIAYCLEANPRASRTVPFVSKATGMDWAGVAARIGLGQSLKQQGVTDGVARAVSVKGVVFPFAKFPGVDPVLGPEMKSTGEVMGIGETFGEAYAKSLLAAGIPLPLSGTVFLTVNDAPPELRARLAHVRLLNRPSSFCAAGVPSGLSKTRRCLEIFLKNFCGSPVPPRPPRTSSKCWTRLRRFHWLPRVRKPSSGWCEDARASSIR